MADNDEIPRSLVRLHKKHIKGTERGAIVKEFSLYLCNLTRAVQQGCGTEISKLYVTSKTIKHLYDKRPAWEYDMVLINMPSIVKYPDEIRKNGSGKRGSLCFVKKIDNRHYMASVEEVSQDDGEKTFYVVTTYTVEESYIQKYPVLWSWKGGKPSS